MNFPIPHIFANDDIETLMKKLRMIVRTMEQFHLQKTADKGLMGLHSLFACMVSLSAEIYDALLKSRIFVAGSLTCQMLELEIQLLWLNKHFATNGSDYMDFGYIEQIDMLRVHPERADKVLSLIKQNNCERFLLQKPKNTNLLDRKNYRQHWYPETVQKISKDTFDDIFKEIKNVPELLEYYDNTDVNYENYQLFCKFKHFSPYVLRECFATSQSVMEDTPQDIKQSILITNLTTILSVCNILEQHGDHILQSKAIATDGLSLSSTNKVL